MFNLKKSLLKLLLLFLCFIFTLQSDCAYASKLDDIFSAIIENSFKKAGKNIDELAALKHGDSFSALLMKNDNFLNVTRKVVDDDVLAIRKIGFPTGSKYIDDLMALTQQQRKVAYALDDVVSRIAKLPSGTDMINTVGKKGLLLGSAYGDEFLEGAYVLARQDEVWDAARLGLKNLDLDKKIIEPLLENYGLTEKIKLIQKTDVLDPVDLMERVARKYGSRGKESILVFFKKAGQYALDFAKENKTVTALGVVVAIACHEPSIILDPLGKLNDKIVDGLLNGIVAIAAKTTASVASMPKRFGDRFIETIAPNLPVFLKTILSYVVAVICFLAILYFIPFTRFIPRSLFKWLASIRLNRRSK